MQTLLIVIIAAAIMAGMIYLHRRHWGFTKLVLLALVLGIIGGGAVQLIYGPTSKTVTNAIDWINIVGNGYIALLQMLVIPLVFVSLVGAFTRLTARTNLKRMTTNVLGILLSTTAVASLIGIVSVLIFHLQGASFIKGMAADSTALSAIKSHQATLQGLTLPQQITNLLPTNIFADFAGTRSSSTIAVVIFSLMVGVAYLGLRNSQPDQARIFAKGIDALQGIVSRLVKMVLELTPYGIFTLMVKATATSSFASIAKLGTFIVAAYVAIIIMFIVHTLILMANRINPVTYYKKAWPALVFAFTSRTSAGTLPLNVKIQRDSLGVSSSVANFAASFGLTIGQNGCAGIYPSMVAAIIAPTAGISVTSWQFILTLIAIDVISSFGVAGVGGGATFTTLMVLGTLNLPVAVMGVLIAIDPIIDMARTALNVNDSILAGVVTAKNLDELDHDKLKDQTNIVANEL
ncbi:L-cystine transporter [Limosilactobacillus sp.]|uniref:L-cystine transporter n=1 Tax=Limosilactobacillus sp. TaxID=2773925 RepID=UPI003F0E9F90